MEYTREQLKAAYALNLCTVSVSQIIDYEDINIMEQEYEAILNNLNLEEMPKDEALLKILKQILDTITYFRIEEGDKKFIEKEYQQKMKNAIWAAVPNIGMLVAGGNAITMATSLASQIGIGYMNYRKEKADNELETERKMWELEKTAIEQFNGLRRELFDTAWRLSAAHNFPDQLRLTERQIKQYNNILMDNDLLRKYARMDAIKDSFLAYPPFWYNFGNTANGISRGDYKISDSTRMFYREKAKEHFIQFRNSNGYGLLREDEISASCALELVDLLDMEQDKELIETLLKDAIRDSGRANDVMQLAAVTYLKLNRKDEAGSLLNQLVNEQYNTILNSQLLSSLYVYECINNKNEEAYSKYEILKEQVGEEYLYPLPGAECKDLKLIEDEFISTQRQLLLEKYNAVATSFFTKYMVKFGQIIPVADQEMICNDAYFMPSMASKDERKYQLKKVFANKRMKENYLYRLQERNIDYALIDFLNEMFEASCDLDFMNQTVQYKLSKKIQNALYSNKNKITDLIMKIENNEFTYFDAEKLIDLDFNCFANEFLVVFMEEIEKFVNDRSEMQDFIIAEENLSEFCQMHGLASPSELVDRENMNIVSEDSIPERKFNINILKDEKVETKKDYNKEIMQILNERKDKICKGDSVEFFIKGDPKIERYFMSHKKLRENNKLMATTIAVLDDLAYKGDYDLIFTVNGIISVKKGSVKGIKSYKSVKFDIAYPDFIIIDGVFNNPDVSMRELSALVKELAKYEINDYMESENNFPFGGHIFRK